MPDQQSIALIVDDEPDICNLISMTLQKMHIRADVAMSVAEARRRLSEKQYDFCLTDLRLPDGEGLEIVEAIQDLPSDRSFPVAVITAHGDMDSAIAALKLGAFDFVSKPVNLKRLRSLVQLALRLNEGRNIAQREYPPLLQGQSNAIRSLRQQMDQIARSDAPVHIFGEPGAGKELVAKSLHKQGARAENAFVPVHCSAIPPEEIDQELFGVFAPSGEKPGLLSTAAGGTIFFDEVTDLPHETQAKLLRAIQDKHFQPLGSSDYCKLNTRIISASRKKLPIEVQHGRFRSDLFYRINVIELSVPPLRKRLEDIPLLVRNILRRASQPSRFGGTPPRLNADALEALQAYSFPGNLRELENILERAIAFSDSNTIRAQSLQFENTFAEESNSGENFLATPRASTLAQTNRPPTAITAPRLTPSDYRSLDDFLQAIEREAIENALSRTRWNRTAAAEELGISFRSLRYRLKKLGLETD